MVALSPKFFFCQSLSKHHVIVIVGGKHFYVRMSAGVKQNQKTNRKVIIIIPFELFYILLYINNDLYVNMLKHFIYWKLIAIRTFSLGKDGRVDLLFVLLGLMSNGI